MARFRRTVPAPIPPKQKQFGFSAFRPFVRADFERRCAYCLIEERFCGGIENYEIDHFRPRARFPKELWSFYNLYWSCHPCNQIKSFRWPTETHLSQGAFIVDLCQDDAEEHFVCGSDGVIEEKTLAGLYTITLLRLNRPHLVELRAFLQLEHDLHFPYHK